MCLAQAHSLTRANSALTRTNAERCIGLSEGKVPEYSTCRALAYGQPLQQLLVVYRDA